ncbi:hypothetical protein GCM10027299_23600 [Larkinella ripae]
MQEKKEEYINFHVFKGESDPVCPDKGDPVTGCAQIRRMYRAEMLIETGMAGSNPLKLHFGLSVLNLPVFVRSVVSIGGN